MTLSTDTLCDPGRLVRRAPGVWHEQLRKEMSALKAPNSQQLYSLTNGVSCFFTVNGRIDLAMEVLSHALGKLRNSKHREKWHAAAAAHALVNTGRIMRLRGEYDAALRIFRSIWPTEGQASLHINGETFLVDNEYEKDCAPMYLIDVTRSLLAKGAFEEAQQILLDGRFKHDNAGIEPIVHELEAGLLVCKGDPQGAMRKIKSIDIHVDRHWIRILQFYYACVAVDLNAQSTALSLVRTLAEYLHNMLRDNLNPDHRLLRMGLALVRLSKQLSCHQEQSQSFKELAAFLKDSLITSILRTDGDVIILQALLRMSSGIHISPTIEVSAEDYLVAGNDWRLQHPHCFTSLKGDLFAGF
jgi:hypothetical protein